MTQKSSKSSPVAARYAGALLDLAAEAGLVEKVEADINDLSSMMDGSEDLRAVIRNPLVGRERQKDAILALADQAKFQTITRNFLGVVAGNRRLGALPSIISAFKSELTRRRGGLEARVQTAYALTPAQTEALQTQLSKAMGAHVTMDVVVDKDILGGLIVTVGSTMIDDSVRRKLERLKRAMSSGSNQNQTLNKEVG